MRMKLYVLENLRFDGNLREISPQDYSVHWIVVLGEPQYCSQSEG